MATLFITEADYADQSGVPKESIKAFRVDELIRADHWDTEGRRVGYTEPGLQLLNIQFGTQITPKSTPEKNGAKKAAAEQLKVLRTPRNKRIVMGVALNAADKRRDVETPESRAHYTVTDDDLRAEVYRVRVRDNTKFVRGMVMTVVHIEADLFELTGNQPRFRGRY